MTKEEIKKALKRCDNHEIGDCGDCPYVGNARCLDDMVGDTLKLITEQEQEIEQLRNEKWQAQDDLECYHSEMQDKIEQAKIEVLESLKTGRGMAIKNLNGEWEKCVLLEDIDEMISDLKGETE